MKKLLMSLLAVLMVCGLMMPVSAEGAVAKIGERTYETLQQALTEAVSGETVELIADVTDLAFANGINEVGHFSYELKDPKAAQKQARLKAIEDAKEKALELAQGFNVKLGMPVNLSYENQGHVIMPRTMMLKATALNSAGAAPESVYMVDDLTINAQVYATYKIEELKEQKD